MPSENLDYDTGLLYLQDANGLGTSIMHDWPSIRVRETPVYASRFIVDCL